MTAPAPQALQAALTPTTQDDTTMTDAVTDAEMLSAWLDGAPPDDHDDTALPASLAAYLADDAGRADWDTFHLIGDVLRTPDLAIAPSPAFTAKLARALANEPAHAPTQTQTQTLTPNPHSGWRSAGARGSASQAPLLRPTSGRGESVSPLPLVGEGARRAGEGVSTRWHWLARPALALAATVALAVWVLRPLLSEDDPVATLVAESTPAALLYDYLDAHRQQVGPSVARQVSFTVTHPQEHRADGP